MAQLFSLTISVVSGGLACVGGALLLGALFPSLRHATLAGPRRERAERAARPRGRRLSPG